MTFKRISLFILIFVSVAALVTAQSNDRELSVEESYMIQSIEMMMINDMSRADSREMKLVALQYIEESIKRGNTGDDVRAALEYLGTEGIINQTRENGRLTNNYPEIRARVATNLGNLGTMEAQKSLMKMGRAEHEPMVLTEIIKSLGRIGLNENNETVEHVLFLVRPFHVLNTDNLLAVSALYALERIAEANGGLRNQEAIQWIMNVSENGYYIREVRESARLLLGRLRQYGL